MESVSKKIILYLFLLFFSCNNPKSEVSYSTLNEVDFDLITNPCDFVNVGLIWCYSYDEMIDFNSEILEFILYNEDRYRLNKISREKPTVSQKNQIGFLLKEIDFLLSNMRKLEYIEEKNNWLINDFEFCKQFDDAKSYNTQRMSQYLKAIKKISLKMIDL
ncbi:MAG: hypothetical protein CMP51_05775 [Flavobacteriales bacterium]|nr:hypothetical protein [Flavobacteriales bacterium]|tara:strand:- start:192 stop:674 length:483 start_codon:yes stop_codon:yes gene_type:complete